MTQSERRIRSMVRAIGQRWYGLQLSRFLTITLVVLVGWLLTMIAVDNLAMLSPLGLTVGWGLLAGGVGLWTMVVLYRLTLGRPRGPHLALMYESRVPGQKNRLINAVQFLVTRQAERDPMARAVVIENAKRLDPSTARLAVDFRSVHRAMAVLAACVLALAVYYFSSPQWVANAMERILNPTDPAAHLMAADLTVTPADTTLIEGAPLTVEAEVRVHLKDYVPSLVELEYRIPGVDWKRDRMTAGVGATFSHTLKAVWHPLEYRVRVGRSVSPTYHVTVRNRPRVEQLQVTVIPPDYTGRKPQMLAPNAGNVTALIGSVVEVGLTATAELSEARLAMADRSQIALDLSRTDRRQAQGRFTVTQNGTYAIHLTDVEKLAILAPPQYTLTAVPDEAPVASITAPARDLVVPVDVPVDLAIEADDDIGLSRTVLQVRLGSADWVDAQQWKIHDLVVQHHAVKTQLKLAEMKLKPNDVILYRAVAYDHRKPEANQGIGRTWSITVAAPAKGENLMLAQAKQLQDVIHKLLEMQRQNRGEFQQSAASPPVRGRQEEIRQLTLHTFEEHRNSPRPPMQILQPLGELANGPMLTAVQLLAKHPGAKPERSKKAIFDVMDQIIARLEELLGKVQKSIAAAEKANEVLQKLSAEEREKSLQKVRDMLDKLRKFMPDQDKVIQDTQELVRKADNLTDPELQKLEKTKGTEDEWAKVFNGSVDDISKLTEQGFADRTVANDYKEMVEQIEEASKNLHPKAMELAVPLEQAGRELAEKLAEDMEMWMPNTPDSIKWSMEEPLDHPEIPMAELPDELSDMIGDLIEEQDDLNDLAEDVTSGWADSPSAAGWGAMDGPISSFSAKGKTGNQLPDKHELSGRSGDGRTGASQGQMVENVAKGLPGRKTPTRITNDPYEQGVVKELQKLATGGATGGGKARGSGQEGLQGEYAPPLMDNLEFMQDWQQRIRQKAERMAGQLKASGIQLPDLEKSIELMKQAEENAAAGRYQEMFKIQQMVVQDLKATGEQASRESSLQFDRAARVPPEQRHKMLDAMEEPMPREYQGAVQKYFQKLSETK